ncbi:MAG: fused MFS/spermidine synthase [Thermodesulfobacteriota bacterium]
MADINSLVQEKVGSKGLILLFFFITGLTGLVYELVWIRLLILAFGSTQFAITTVLVTFMAGLALGSLIFGRIVDRVARPLLVYAIIEIVLGLYCITSPQVFLLVRDLYAAFSWGGEGVNYASFEWIQFILSFSALIIPTTLLGGTLPALVKYLASASGRVGFHTAVPYAVNTLGAVAGCLATGFFLLYFLGLKATLYSAGVLDLLVGAAVYLLYCRTGSIAIKEPGAGQAGKGAHDGLLSRNAVIIAAFVISGFCSLSYEVLWTRVFSLVIGSSVYAFTIMLATFLAGIGAGSILFAPYVDRVKKPLVWFAALEGVIGFTGLFSIFIYKKLPFIFYSLKQAFDEQFILFQIIQFGLCATIIIIPTLCMGALFPLVGRIYTRGHSTIGQKIGNLYFSNTAGSIFGSFAAGFILIPFLGVQNGVTITTALNIFIAIIILSLTELRPAVRGAISAAFIAVFFISALSLPPWEKMVMTTGLYVNPLEKGEVESLEKGQRKDRLLYYREGINAVITVRERVENNRTIRTYQANGKQEALSINGLATGAWAALGHVPMLLHSGPAEDALLVGLGAGITLGAMEYYPMKSVDVVEIEPAVAEAAGFFSRSNNNALADPRVRMHIADGRSFLFSTEKKYDVIISAVSDPWITGVANLFTYEYFSGLRDKLKEGGTVAIWFQNYRATPEEVRIGLNTFASVFPHIGIWFHYTDALDLIVTGAMEPQRVDINELKERFKNAGVRRALSYIEVEEPVDFFDLFLIDDEDLRGYIGETMLNTDERPLIEFTLPRHLYMDTSSGTRNVEEILTHVKAITPPLLLPDKDKEDFYLALGKSYSMFSFRLPQAYAAFGKVLEINPGNSEAAVLARGLKKELGY